MKYCNKLFKEINFEPQAIAPCCNTQAITVPSMSYAGGPVDLQKYAERMSEAFTQMQAGGKICRDCMHIEEKETIPQSNGQFSAVSLNMHRYLCNCRCEYCDLWNVKSEKKVYDILPALKSLQEQGALQKNCLISWGGGESSIYSGFEAAANWALENGYFQNIHSNAIRFSPNIAAILEAKKGRINVSLDSGSPETYQLIKGVDCYAKVTENLRHYATLNPDAIELKYIIYEKNNEPAEIDKFLNFAKENGIKNIQVSFNFLEQNVGKVSQKSLLSAALMTVKAINSDINIVPFFIHPDLLAKIRAYITNL